MVGASPLRGNAVLKTVGIIGRSTNRWHLFTMLEGQRIVVAGSESLLWKGARGREVSHSHDQHKA